MEIENQNLEVTEIPEVIEANAKPIDTEMSVASPEISTMDIIGVMAGTAALNAVVTYGIITVCEFGKKKVTALLQNRKAKKLADRKVDETVETL